MPRKPKTPAGRRAQGVEAISGQMYGRGVEQEQLQRAMPAPNAQAEQQSMMRQAAAQGGGVPVPQAQPSFDQILSAAQGAGRGAGLLTTETQRPDEPLTAGLLIGRGPGPEALMFRPPVAPGTRFLTRLTELTGDPYFARLAERGRP